MPELTVVGCGIRAGHQITPEAEVAIKAADVVFCMTTDPFAARVASTFRFAVDTAALDEALVSLAPGQSGHPGHPHFSDGVERWREGRPQLLAASTLLVEESSRALLRLEPAP